MGGGEVLHFVCLHIQAGPTVPKILSVCVYVCNVYSKLTTDDLQSKCSYHNDRWFQKIAAFGRYFIMYCPRAFEDNSAWQKSTCDMIVKDHKASRSENVLF